MGSSRCFNKCTLAIKIDISAFDPRVTYKTAVAKSGEKVAEEKCTMSYRYIDSVTVSDVAFTARGKTVEKLFLACWDATLNVMVGNPQAIDKKIIKKFEIKNRDLDMLLFDFLQELIYYKDAEGIFLRIEHITIHRSDTGYSLSADVKGERIDRSKHKVLVDVKAVTMYRFNVEHVGGIWHATVVLDV